MEIGLIALLLIPGLLYTGVQAIECYACSDCQGARGVANVCSLQSTFCYVIRTSTGEEYKACGDEHLAVSFTSDGCRTVRNTTTCRCSTSLCNTLDLLPSQQSSTTTESDAFHCYQCNDCGTSSGILADCSQFRSSRNCYYSLDTDGTINRVCGTEDLDRFNLAVGCSTIAGLKVCKCNESGCNTDPESIAASAHTTTSSTTRGVVTTTSSDTWQCYNCNDCGNSIGTVNDCSWLTESRSCLLMRSASGRITRSCGLKYVDDLGIVDGCGTYLGNMYCKCSTNACNAYPEYLVPPTEEPSSSQISTTNTTTATTTETPWYCYECVNCGVGMGVLLQCPTAKSCVVKTSIADGTVVKSCGSPEIDIIVPQENGCKTANDGILYCKCSTNACNNYINDDVTHDPSVSSQTSWHIFHTTTNCCSSTVYRDAMWLVISTAVLVAFR